MIIKHICIGSRNYKINNFNWIARCAAENNHKELVYEMIFKGANNFQEIAEWAAENNHKEL